MTRVLLVLLLAFSLEHAPFRLVALIAQAFVMPAGYTRLASGTSRYWDVKALEFRLTRLGWNVRYEDDLMRSGIYGITDPDRHTITIDASLSWNERLSVLAHESAHAFQPGPLTRGQSEVFAESVAMLVARDGTREHARYLALWRADLLTAVVYGREIYHTAAILAP